MGFFYQKADKAKAKKGAGKTGPRRSSVGQQTKQSSETLQRLGCRACPLSRAGNEVREDVPRRCDIFFLGEAPGPQEEQEGVPFIGKSGKLLKSMIPNEYYDNCGYGNTVRHFPKNAEGKIRPPEWIEQECCRGYVTAAIEEAAPKLIVGLGIPALQWMLGTKDMQGMRGRFFAVTIGKHECWFFPTNHPAYVLRSAKDDRRPLNGRVGGAWKLDFEQIWRFMDDDPPWPEVWTQQTVKKDVNTYSGERPEDDFDSLMREFDDIERGVACYATDLETWPLRPYRTGAIILTAAFSYYDRHLKLRTFSFGVDHPKANWSKAQRQKILDRLEALIRRRDIPKIAHNSPFEMEWYIFYFGEDIVHHNSWEDTMVQAYILDGRKGPNEKGQDDHASQYQKLGFLTRQHFGIDIKSQFKLDKKDLRKSPYDQVLIYNGADTRATLQLWFHQDKLIRDIRQEHVYEMAMPRQGAVALMQHYGVPINQKTAKRLQGKLEDEVKGIVNDILGLKVVKKYVSEHKGEFNPESQPQVLTIFRDYLKRPEVFVKDKKDSDKVTEKVDKAVLEKIDHPLAPLIIKLRNKVKMKSTYVDQMILPDGTLIFPDGKLHTSFNTTFTTTARLSSDDPNMQNWPKHKDAWIREQVEALEGHVFVSVDFGQLEWCTACMFCNDKNMVGATWKEYDVHKEWALKIGKRWPWLFDYFKEKQGKNDEDALKGARSLVKNKMVFPVIFGAAEPSVASYFLPFLGEAMPDNVAQDIFEEFWETFSGLKEWQDETMRTYYDVGYVETFTGRRRYYPMSRHELYNSPIQSLAADIVNDGMVRISRSSLKHKIRYRHPIMQIHDDLTFMMPDKDSILADEISYLARELLLLPYDFINVPMSVEVSIGKKWNKLEPVGKYWSENYKSFDSQGI